MLDFKSSSMTFRTDKNLNLNSASDSLQPFGTETEILIPETDIPPPTPIHKNFHELNIKLAIRLTYFRVTLYDIYFTVLSRLQESWILFFWWYRTKLMA